MAELRLHQIAPSQCDLLVKAVSRGDMTAVASLLDANPLAYLGHVQGKALLKACVTAPNAVALVDLFQARKSNLFRGTTKHLADPTFFHACQHGGDVATVQRIVVFLHGDRRPDVEKGLLAAMKTRNEPLVEHLVTSFEPGRDRDYGALLLVAVGTNNQAFVLRFMVMPAVLEFLASLEAAFEPCFIRQGAARHHPHEWLVQAITRGMRAVVELAAERAPLVTSDVVVVLSPLLPDGAASYAHLRTQRESLNHQIEVFHHAIQAGYVGVVRSMLEEVPVLRRSQMDSGETALMASSVAPNSIEVLQCLRDHGATIEAVRLALLHACQHDTAADTIDFLWNWVESFDLTAHARETLLWEAISTVTSEEYLDSLSALLAYVRDWLAEDALNLLPSVMQTSEGNPEYVCSLIEMRQMQVLFTSLESMMACETSAGTDYASPKCYCTCPSTYECDFKQAVSTVSDWIEDALNFRMPTVVTKLDKWWPALTRKAAFERFHSKFHNRFYGKQKRWAGLRALYARDVTWHHTRNAHLVQRCRLPGLDPLGSLIATYLYVFNTEDQLYLLEQDSSEPEGSEDYEPYDSEYGDSGYDDSERSDLDNDE